MILFTGKLTPTTAWEIALLHKLRKFKDGLSALEFSVNWDRYVGDHKPSTRFHLILLNYTIIELSIFSTLHQGEPDEPEENGHKESN